MRQMFISKGAYFQNYEPLTCYLLLCSFSQKLHAIVIDLLLLMFHGYSNTN